MKPTDTIESVREVAANCSCRVCLLARVRVRYPGFVEDFARRVLRDAEREEREEIYQAKAVGPPKAAMVASHVDG